MTSHSETSFMAGARSLDSALKDATVLGCPSSIISQVTFLATWAGEDETKWRLIQTSLTYIIDRLLAFEVREAPLFALLQQMQAMLRGHSPGDLK